MRGQITIPDKRCNYCRHYNVGGEYHCKLGIKSCAELGCNKYDEERTSQTDIGIDIERFAYDWIYELDTDMRKVHNAYHKLSKCGDWRKVIEYEIEKRAWHERYRKVSQLCWSIGGEVLDKFKQMFPDRENTFMRYTNWRDK